MSSFHLNSSTSSNMLCLELFIVTLLCGLLYLSIAVWKAMTYWKVRGVKHLTPMPIVGNLGRILKLDKHWTYFYNEIYYAFPQERMVGMYEFMTPTLVLRDPQLIEHVLVREFSSYQDHGPFILESKSILFESVFALAGVRWRAIRNQLLTTFTTGKMKSIFPELVMSCQEVVEIKPNKLTKDFFNEFAIKSFLKSMFGTEILGAGEQELFTNCKKVFEASSARMIQQYALTYFPKLSEFFNLTFMPKELDNYFASLMNTLLNQREKIKSNRNDYAQVLVEMRKLDQMNVYNRENNKVDETFAMTNNIALSQAFMFFFAGLDTTSLLMLHLAFDLSLAKDCQEKARQEVRTVLEKYGGYSWEAVRDMKYLDQCIQESLRMHPSLQFLVRFCNKDTELDGVIIEKNTRIVIPSHTIHMDPKHYPSPHNYDPDRFREENISKQFTHLPFSNGPRVCLGKRFATMETATLFAHILDNFELSPSPEMKQPLQYEPNALFLTPIAENPISVILTKIS